MLGIRPESVAGLRRYYADVVIASLQDSAYAALTAADEGPEIPTLFEKLAAIPRPMLEDNWDFDSECLTGKLLQRSCHRYQM